MTSTKHSFVTIRDRERRGARAALEIGASGGVGGHNHPSQKCAWFL